MLIKAPYQALHLLSLNSHDNSAKEARLSLFFKKMSACPNIDVNFYMDCRFFFSNSKTKQCRNRKLNNTEK